MYGISLKQIYKTLQWLSKKKRKKSKKLNDHKISNLNYQKNVNNNIFNNIINLTNSKKYEKNYI